MLECLYYGESTEKTPTKKSKATELSKSQLVHRKDKTGAHLSKTDFMTFGGCCGAGGLSFMAGLLPLSRFPRASAGAGVAANAD